MSTRTLAVLRGVLFAVILAALVLLRVLPLARLVTQSPKLVAVDEAIGAEGWNIVALLRLSPTRPALARLRSAPDQPAAPS